MSTLPHAAEAIKQLEQGRTVKTGEWIYKSTG